MGNGKESSEKEKEYYPNGELKIEREIIGEREIIKKYYPNKKLAQEIVEKKIGDDKEISNKIYYTNGELYYYEEIKKIGDKSKGTERYFNLAGELQQEYISDGEIITYKERRKDVPYDYKEGSKNLLTGEWVGERKEYVDNILILKQNYNEKGEPIGEQILYDEDGEIIKSQVIDKNGKLLSSYSNKSFWGDFSERRELIKGTDKYKIIFEDEEGNTQEMMYEKLSGDPSIDYKESGEGKEYDSYGIIVSETPTNQGDKEGVHKTYRSGIVVDEKNYKSDRENGKQKNYWLDSLMGEYYITEYTSYYEDYETKNKDYILWYPNGKKYKEIVGEVTKYYTPSGKLAWEDGAEGVKIHDKEFYNARTRGGRYESYYSKGELAFSGEYNERGELSGEAKMFYENGKPLYEMNYSQDEYGRYIPIDIKLYDKSGKIYFETQVRDGVRVLEKSYYSNGQLRLVDRRGLDGSKSEERFFENGKSMGKTFYSDEIDEVLEGEFTRYYLNGNIKISANFVKGLVVGEYKRYSSNGKLKYSINYDTLEKKEYFKEGELKNLKVYNDKKTLSKDIDYWKNGNVKIERLYNETGKKISEKKYYANGVLKEDENGVYYMDGTIHTKLKDGKVEKYYYPSGKIYVDFSNGNKVYYREDGLKMCEIKGNERIDYSVLGEKIENTEK